MLRNIRLAIRLSMWKRNKNMKKIIIPALALLLCANAEAQKIKTSTEVLNIGQVQYCLPANGVFELKNTGNRPLVISNVDTGCGCTVASYPTEAIDPGDTFTISVTYDARMMGHFQKYVDIYSNASDKPLTLQLSGVVVAEVQDYVGDFPFALGELTADCNAIELEDVHLGEKIQQRFHVFNPTGKTVRPQVMHLPAYLKAEVSPTKVASNRSAEITITLDSRFIHDFGYEDTEIYLGANPGEKVSASKKIDVSAIFLPAKEALTTAQKAQAPKIEISSTDLVMPVDDGKKRTETIIIQNTGKSRLEIQRMQMLSEGIKVQLNKTSLAPNETAKLKVTTVPRQLKHVKRIPRILMITNDPERQKILVNVMTK